MEAGAGMLVSIRLWFNRK